MNKEDTNVEEGDLIAESLDKKTVFKEVQRKARTWFISYVDGLTFNK